jgi:hypothetical protein
MDSKETVDVECMHFDREGRWTKTITLTRPVYIAHVDAKVLYKGMWEHRNGPMKRGEILVVMRESGGGPLPVLIRERGGDKDDG